MQGHQTKPKQHNIENTLIILQYTIIGCMVITYSRVWINRVSLPILLVVSWTGKMNIPLSPYVPGNLVSRDGFSRPVPRQPAHSPYSGYLVLTYGIPPEFRGGIQHHTPSGQSRVYRVRQMCTDGVHCRQESAVYKRISTCLLYQ